MGATVLQVGGGGGCYERFKRLFGSRWELLRYDWLTRVVFVSIVLDSLGGGTLHACGGCPYGLVFRVILGLFCLAVGVVVVVVVGVDVVLHADTMSALVERCFLVASACRQKLTASDLCVWRGFLTSLENLPVCVSLSLLVFVCRKCACVLALPVLHFCVCSIFCRRDFPRVCGRPVVGLETLASTCPRPRCAAATGGSGSG